MQVWSGPAVLVLGVAGPDLTQHGVGVDHVAHLYIHIGKVQVGDEADHLGSFAHLDLDSGATAASGTGGCDLETCSSMVDGPLRRGLIGVPAATP